MLVVPRLCHQWSRSDGLAAAQSVWRMWRMLCCAHGLHREHPDRSTTSSGDESSSSSSVSSSTSSLSSTSQPAGGVGAVVDAPPALEMPVGVGRQRRHAHQGDRKLPELTREQAQTTEETLARMERELPEAVKMQIGQRLPVMSEPALFQKIQGCVQQSLSHTRGVSAWLLRGQALSDRGSLRIASSFNDGVPKR